MKNMKKAAAVTIAVGGLAFAGAGAASAQANGNAQNSPGIASGNVVQVPVKVPVNLCGNTVSVVGLFNPAAGNVCINK
ncbi:chaplin [Streptomyces syringium]|uniref:chaplin n=1 Tax=Streptomyces syringium TaxID=76729 RepID=UPI003455648F